MLPQIYPLKKCMECGEAASKMKLFLAGSHKSMHLAAMHVVSRVIQMPSKNTVKLGTAQQYIEST